VSQNQPTRIYDERPKHPVSGDCALVDGPSSEGDRTVDCSTYPSGRTSSCIGFSPDREPIESDALIVKAYAMSASRTRLAVLIGGGFVVVEESRIR
jgi:hypothetical protein